MNVYVSPLPPEPPKDKFPGSGTMILVSLFATMCVSAILMMVIVIYGHHKLTGRYYAKDLACDYSLVLIGEKGYKVGDWVISSHDTIINGANSRDWPHTDCSAFEIKEVIKDKE